MHSSRVIPAFATALTAGLMLAAQAMAQTTTSEVTVRAPPRHGVEVKHEVVKFSDLDLKAAAGAETMVGRIRGAASRVCMPAPTQKAEFKDVSDYQTCRTQAVSGAAKDLGSPMVDQVLKRTGD
jgi:UrcA family protein